MRRKAKLTKNATGDQFPEGRKLDALLMVHDGLLQMFCESIEGNHVCLTSISFSRAVAKDGYLKRKLVCEYDSFCDWTPCRRAGRRQVRKRK